MTAAPFMAPLYAGLFFWGFCLHIRCCGNGHLGFRSYSQPFQGVFFL
ncbi:hypothetical protein AN403_5725 [Pseudomonas fluorescens]|uniref:Uncharacterized protein n=1 Tax=Pseudomonas fluorescens TaxID=294 RepID=A0A0P8X665_PSEFL|nr:hypothetical protein AN403_5725 [Pseudomonas fluorescens]